MRKLRHKSRTKSIHTLAQKSWGRRVLDNKWFSATMTAWTVFALFGDDFRLLTTFSPADVPFSILAIIAMVLFAFELVLNSIERPEWRFGFYFWLDFAATVSVLPDIMWFNELLEGGGSAEGQETLELGRTSRASTKAGRFVRVVRLVRMVRMVKLYKMRGATTTTCRLRAWPSRNLPR